MSKFCRQARRGNARKGQSLLLVFFMLIAIIGVMALTLDFGFVLQSRRLMQTGVNTAAMEGLRNYDTDQDGTGDGRQNAATLMKNVFDDNMDPSTNQTTVGAGIDSSLVQGNGYRQTVLGNGTGARSLFENRSSFIYRPDPQLNTMNRAEGDMVRGDFDEAASDHSEFSDYQRNDFTVDETGNLISSFLVRLRRTHDPDGLDRLDGISSGSGGLPLLVGRLGWFTAEPADAEYAIRRDGVIVRATAIADSQVAVRVWPSTNTQIYSAIPFGISKADFISQSDVGLYVEPTTSLVTQFGEPASFSSSGSYSGEVGYVAVIDQTLSPARAIGFFLIDSASTLSRHANASSRSQDVWDVLCDLTEAERAAIYSSRQNVMDNSVNQLLMTGSLVRSIR